MQRNPSLKPDQADPQRNGALSSFDFQPQTRVVFGVGSIEGLGERARELGGTRVLLVSDEGLAEAGHEKLGLQSLEAAGLDVAVFDDVTPNPTTDDVDRALEVARGHQADLIVGLGGGSSMDCAKGVNFLYTNGGRMADYWGVGKATQPMLPMIAVPTTAGTGSEAQSFALIADPKTHMKMACGDKKAACRVAILDPRLTLTMPPSVTTATGIDALSHAVETYVTKVRNPISQIFSRRSWNLLVGALPRVVADPQDMEARGAMLLGAHLAGAAIENSMLGAVHSMANPLTAHFGITHGIAIGVMMPHVVRYNGEAVAKLYGELASDAGLCEPGEPAAPQLLADHIETLVANCGAPTSLVECDADISLVNRLADEAARQWTAEFNPRPIDRDRFEELYRCAFEPSRHTT